MVGDFDDKNQRGIIPRSFDQIFDTISNNKEMKYNVYLSFIQIYLETIQDLLEPTNENIRIREDPEQGVHLEGVQWVKVTNPQECENVFCYGEKNRSTASTKMNAHSSRSHAIMVVKIEKSLVISPEKIKEITQESSDQIKTERVMTRSMLFLVDLAGSERVKKTKAEAMRLEEAKKINYSLLVLGNCIQSLTDPKCNHISYRDSKLTRLLQESLGGNAKTSLIVTISPSTYNLDESISTLMFGQRAMKVQNKPIINKTVDYQALCIKLQEDLDKLNDEHALLKVEYDKIVQENKKIKNSEVYLDMQRKSVFQNLNPEEERESMKSTFSLSNSAIDEVKERCAEEIKKLETFYEEVLKNRINEYENILQDIDKVLYEKENDLEKLKNENLNYKEKNENLVDIMKDSEREKEDLQKSIVDLTNEIIELKREKEKSDKELTVEKYHSEKLKNLFNIEKNAKSTQTENEAINQNILYIADKMKLTSEENKVVNYDVLEKIIHNLNEEISIKTKLLEDKSNNFMKLLNSQKEKELEFEKTSNELNLNKTTLDEKIRDLENKISEITNLEIKLKETESKLKSSESKVNGLENKHNDAQNRLLNSENKYSILEIKLGTAETRYLSAENKINIIESEMKISESKINELKNLNKNLEEKIITLKKEHEEELTLISLELSDHKKNKGEIIKEKEDAVKEINLKVKSLEEIKKKLELNLDQKEKDIKSLETKLSILEKNKYESVSSADKEIKDRDRKIKELEINYKNSAINVQSLNNLLKFNKASFQESENILVKNLNALKTGLTSINHLKDEFTEIENYIDEGETLINLMGQKDKIEDKTKLIEKFVDKFFHSLADSENFNILKNSGLKLNIKENPDFSLSSSKFLDRDRDHYNPKLKDSGSKYKSKSKSPDKYTLSQNLLHSTNKSTDLINTDSLNKKFKDLSNLLDGVSENYIFFLNSFFNTTKFFLEFIQNICKSFTEKSHENKSNNLELELSKKNESYLKNSIICLLQKSIDTSTSVISIPANNIEEIILNFNIITTRISEMSCPELNKSSMEVIDKIYKILYTGFNEKQMEVENLNEKVIYYLREIEILKKNEKTEKSEKSTGTNTSILKLQSQLKLKEEEIERLNNRLQEHLKTIKTLTNELHSKSGNSIVLSTSLISGPNSINENQKIGSGSASGFSNSLQKRMSFYEDEINDLKKQINCQKTDFEVSFYYLLTKKFLLNHPFFYFYFNNRVTFLYFYLKHRTSMTKKMEACTNTI